MAKSGSQKSGVIEPQRSARQRQGDGRDQSRGAISHQRLVSRCGELRETKAARAPRSSTACTATPIRHDQAGQPRNLNGRQAPIDDRLLGQTSRRGDTGRRHSLPDRARATAPARPSRSRLASGVDPGDPFGENGTASSDLPLVATARTVLGGGAATWTPSRLLAAGRSDARSTHLTTRIVE